MKPPAYVTDDFDRSLQELLLKFQRLAQFDVDRAAQEAMVVGQMMHEYLVLAGAAVE
jgi:hypothetical protein